MFGLKDGLTHRRLARRLEKAQRETLGNLEETVRIILSEDQLYDIQSGHTHIGVHRDDFHFSVVSSE